jgi:endo-1,4-beta-xylanase
MPTLVRRYFSPDELPGCRRTLNKETNAVNIEVSPRPGDARRIGRRTLLRALGGLLANAAIGRQMPGSAPAGARELKDAARRAGILLSVFTGMHQVRLEPESSAFIAGTFGMIADGNDLKFSNRLRPTPDTFDFSSGDSVVSWAEEHRLLFRGHCLIWWNALPRWFGTYVTKANVRDVLMTHVATVVRRYAGRVYSWDVVNEPIYHDHRPDGLRKRPWLDLLGPEYIDLAFHTAAAADPRAHLILNECYIEHDTPAEISRRESLLALATRLKKSGVPVTGIGIQGHLRGSTALDRVGLTRFLQQLRDLGLEIMITELDVDELGVPGSQLGQAAAGKIGEFLDIVCPYVSAITLEALRNEPYAPTGGNNNAHTQNLFDEYLSPTLAYKNTLQVLQKRAHDTQAAKSSRSPLTTQAHKL